MRLIWVLASAAAALLTTVTAQGAAINETQLLMKLPSCGLNCLIQEIPKSNCSAADLPCICANAELNSMISLCVTQSCTIRESLTTQNITSTLCQVPIRDRTGLVSIAGAVGGGIAVFVVALRLIARLPRFGGKFGMDDAVMIVVVALVIPMAILSVVLADKGLGKDIWTVPFDNITFILYVYYFDEDIYLCILPLTKISILFTYLRIFPKKAFRIVTYVVIGLNVAYLITFVLITVFQCRPLDAAWLRWDGEYPAQCDNINAQAWAASAINMCLDIITMSLPLRELSKLSLSLRKKLLVMIMFSLGFFVTIVSMIRLHSLVQFANTTNITWDYVEIGYWSTIEVDVGVICACLPAVRILLWHIFPRVFESTNRSGAKTPYYSQSRSMQSTGRMDSRLQNRPANEDDGDFIPLVEVTTQSTSTKMG